MADDETDVAVPSIGDRVAVLEDLLSDYPQLKKAVGQLVGLHNQQQQMVQQVRNQQILERANLQSGAVGDSLPGLRIVEP